MNLLRRFGFLLLAAAFAASAPAADLTVTAGNVIASPRAKIITGVAGATITAGQPVYKAVAGTYSPADANASAVTAKVIGIALNGASVNQPLLVCTEDPSFTPGATVAAGTVLIQSATAGGIAPAADAATGWYVSVLGAGIGSNKINLKIIRSNVAKP